MHRTVSAVSVILLLFAVSAMLVAVALSFRALGPKNGGATVGIAHNVLGALGMLPLLLVLLAGTMTGDSPWFLGRIPDLGIFSFGGMMAFSFPGLGVYLSRGQARWRVVLGNVLGALVLLAGAACFGFLRFVAAARFVA